MPREKWTDERLDDLNKKADDGFAQLHSDVRAVRTEMNQQVTGLRIEMNERFDKVDARFEKMDERFDKVDARFEKMDERFEKFNERLESFYRVLVGTAGMVVAGLIGLIGANAL